MEIPQAARRGKIPESRYSYPYNKDTLPPDISPTQAEGFDRKIRELVMPCFVLTKSSSSRSVLSLALRCLKDR